MIPSATYAFIALFFGVLFFSFAARYYLFTATIFVLQFISSLRVGSRDSNGHKGGNGKPKGKLNGFAFNLSKSHNGNGNHRSNVNSNGNGNHGDWQSQPLVSIHIATYNERNVVDRILAACMSLDYSNYEVIVVDDSVDETVNMLDRWKNSSQIPLTESHATDGGQLSQAVLALQRPALKIVHRQDRAGFKGGALNEALRHMDPRAEYVIVLDADFVPAPDMIKQFLAYVYVPDISLVFNEILGLDEAFAQGKLELDDFLEKRESLVAKVVARRPIEAIAKAGRKAITELDRLYSEETVSLEAYLKRRRQIIDTVERLGIDLLALEPLSNRSSLINAFELDQLLASGKIELDEYVRRRRLVAPKAEKIPRTDKVTLSDIIKLDRLYAEGRIADEAWYKNERAWLVSKFIGETEQERLRALFEADRLFANDSIDMKEFLEKRLKLSGGQNGNGNGNGNGKAVVWRLRKKRGNNGNGYHNGAANGNRKTNEKVVAVQGYQWHYLNKSESWLTQGVRAEYSGNYVIERSCQEIFGGMKMIAGSVYMIRADVLRQYGWSTSITEDWELTCRLYNDGYKVQFSPLIQVPAEAPSTIARLVRQRQRWAEGHTYNAKKYFWKIIKSPNISVREKLEFSYFAPYYLQSLFFMIGTAFWLVSEATHEYVPMWTAVFGWSLLLSNLIALPLMNLAGVFAEGTAKKDLGGVISTIVLSYILAPFQAYAALKGLLEQREGQWIRTFKTGKVTEPIYSLRLRGIWKKVRSGKHSANKSSKPQPSSQDKASKLPSGAVPLALVIILSLSLVTITALSFTVRESAAIPANTTWYFYNDPGFGTGTCGGFGTLSTTAPAASTLSLKGNKMYCWATTITYSVSSTDSGNWVFHLVFNSNNYGTATITVTVYFSTTQTTLGTQQGQTSFSSSGLASPTDITIPVTVTVPNGNYFVQFSWTSSGAAGGSNIVMVTSSVGSTLKVPEAAMILASLVPFIPLIVRRKAVLRSFRRKFSSIIGGFEIGN